MSKFQNWSAVLIACTLVAGHCLAQEDAPQKFYRLDFVVKEVDGSKVSNSRAFSTVVESGKTHAEIRAGSKVHYNVSSIPGSTQYSMADVGVNLDVNSPKQIEDRLSFDLVAEVSAIAKDAEVSSSPVIRQLRWNCAALVPFKKPTVLLSSDNVDAKGQTVLEVTVTPIP